MHKWIISIAVSFIAALFVGIAIGRYHYEHITLNKIKDEYLKKDNQKNEIIQSQLLEIEQIKNKLSENENINQVQNKCLNVISTPIKDIFFGETLDELSLRFPNSLVDCNDNENEYKTWLLFNQEYTLNPLFSKELLKINTYNKRVYGIEICYLEDNDLKEKCYNELSQRLINKYELINLKEGPLIVALFAGFKQNHLYDTLVFKKKNGIFIILTKVMDLGVSIKYVSPDILFGLLDLENKKPSQSKSI